LIISQTLIKEIQLLGKLLGTNLVSIKSAQIYDFEAEEKKQHIPLNQQFSRYIISNGKTSIKSTFPNRCFRLWTSAVVNSDGEVVPCCFDKNAQFAMGNLKESNFAQIWNNKLYKQFRNRILLNRKSIEICRNCIEGLNG